MKKGIHPDYTQFTVSCNCGASYEVRSTTEFNRIDVCSACHPFYTGKQKIIDSAGQVEKFKKLAEAAQKLKDAKNKEKEEAAA